MHKIPMTMKGHEKLHLELDRLKTKERPHIIKAIAEARSHGDLRENAEYHAAKEQQAFIEGRIHEIEHKLTHAQVIDVSKMPKNGRVIFGSTVTLLNIEEDTRVTYKIVGEDEADIKHHTISITSPIARAMVGKYEGDEVVVNTPQGDMTYEIVKVEYI